MRPKKREEPRVKETVIQKHIMELLQLKGFVVIRHNNGGIYDPRRGVWRKRPPGQIGISDVLACSPTGQFWAIEVKRPGEKATDEQKMFLDDVRRHGGVGVLAYSVDDVLNLFTSG